MVHAPSIPRRLRLDDLAAGPHDRRANLRRLSRLAAIALDIRGCCRFVVQLITVAHLIRDRVPARKMIVKLRIYAARFLHFCHQRFQNIAIHIIVPAANHTFVI